MKWIVSVQFTRAKAYHQFFSLLNRGLIKDTVKVNHSHADLIVEFETTTPPDKKKLKAWGKVIDIKILD